MSDVGDPKLYAHQPLSVDEVSHGGEPAGPGDAAPAGSGDTACHRSNAVPELPMMTAAQRFWLAFTGKPGSSGRAGPAYEPGLPTESAAPRRSMTTPSAFRASASRARIGRTRIDRGPAGNRQLLN